MYVIVIHNASLTTAKLGRKAKYMCMRHSNEQKLKFFPVVRGSKQLFRQLGNEDYKVLQKLMKVVQ